MNTIFLVFCPISEQRIVVVTLGQTVLITCLSLATARTFVAITSVVGVAFDGGTVRSVRAASLTSQVESKLRHSTNAYREDHHRARQCRHEQGHGDRHSSTSAEELNTHVTRVLSDEID